MHRNLSWRTAEGLVLDSGAFTLGLERAAGVEATVVGKPSAQFFASVLGLLGVSAEEAVMVGDDIEADVLGAQAAGIRGVLVRTGKFRPQDLDRGDPVHVIDSVADLPALLA
jgi:ribonucleotide monophosphatase NagD (HAD superfamily)